MTKKSEFADLDRQEWAAKTKRKRLLARIASHVAAGLLVSPSPRVSTSEKVATVAVDIAEAILDKVGL